MWTSALFGAKTFGFFESARTKGEEVLSQCGHFADKGEGSIFRNFVRMSFWTSPYNFGTRFQLVFSQKKLNLKNLFD